MSCEQVIYQGYKLNLPVVSVVKNVSLGECSTLGCLDSNVIGYTYNLSNRDCTLYHNPEKITLIPIPTENILIKSDDSNDVTGFYQKRKVKTWIVPLLLSLFVIAVSIFLAPVRSRFKIGIVVTIVVLVGLCLYVKRTNELYVLSKDQKDSQNQVQTQ